MQRTNKAGEFVNEATTVADSADLDSLLHTDASMDLEDHIAMNQFETDELKMEKFRIGTQQYKLEMEDPIFVSVGPNKDLKKNHDCYSCKLVTFQKEKEMHHCLFCGNANCKDCCQKSRFFPKAKLDSNGDKPRGKICKFCERKFLIRQVLLEASAKIQKQRHIESKLQAELDRVEQRLISENCSSNLKKWNLASKQKDTKVKIEQVTAQNTLMYMQLQELKKERDAAKNAAESAKSKAQKAAEEAARKKKEEEERLAEEARIAKLGEEERKLALEEQRRQDLLKQAAEQKRIEEERRAAELAAQYERIAQQNKAEDLKKVVEQPSEEPTGLTIEI